MRKTASSFHLELCSDLHSSLPHSSDTCSYLDSGAHLGRAVREAWQQTARGGLVGGGCGVATLCRCWNQAAAAAAVVVLSQPSTQSRQCSSGQRVLLGHEAVHVLQLAAVCAICSLSSHDMCQEGSLLCVSVDEL